jgi:hypothetical protein
MTKWVKCSEQPIPKLRKILFYTNDSIYLGKIMFENDEIIRCMGNGGIGLVYMPLSLITHWSFLPEAPKDEQG